MSASYTYAQAKQALTDAGFTPSSGSNWLASDQAQWEQFVVSAAYGKNGNLGQPYTQYGADYGFAYQSAPTWLTDIVSSGTPSSGTP
jgi:hypothetical protein